MRPAAHHVIDEAEYLFLEEGSPYKHEYFQGQALMMAGGTPRHNEVCGNVFAALKGRLRGGPCQPFNSDQRVRTSDGLYTYPDVSVFCGRVELFPDGRSTATNPVALVEVLFPSTSVYDRGEKLALYKAMPTLRDVLLVEVDTPHVEHVYRTEHGWEVRIAHGPEAEVKLVGVDVTLPLAEVYERGIALG